jgi:membrane protease subunit HflK
VNIHVNDSVNDSVHSIRTTPHLKNEIEQFLQDLERWFNGLRRSSSGKRSGGNGDHNGTGPTGGGAGGRFFTEKSLTLIIGVLVGVWAVLTSFYTVDISDEAVITRFGAYHRTTAAGFYLKLPFGIERVQLVQSKKILQEEFGFRTSDTSGQRSTFEKKGLEAESLMLTGDLNVADVEWILQFRIADPWKFLFHARDVRSNIRDVSMSIMRRVVGDRLVGEVLTTGRVEIADQAKILTQEVIDRYDMGIKIEKVILQGVNPPEKVKPAFNEVNAAKQEQEQTINNAEKEYNRVIPESRGKADKLIADAEAYAIDIVNRAKGDASQINQVIAEYKKAPEITRRRLYIDAMEDLFSRAPEVTIVDSSLKGLLPVLPTYPSAPAAAAASK